MPPDLEPLRSLAVREAYEQARQRLIQVGYESDEARATVRLLLDAITGIRHAYLLAPEHVLSEDEQARWANALHRLQAGEPLPHVLGEIHFCGLVLCTDARALIPRPETELLVETALHRLRDTPAPRVADLGTGSGAIALVLAQARPDAHIWATDLSPDALQLARENAQQLHLEERLDFIPGQLNDWAGSLPPTSFDAVLSNPPYIPSTDIPHLQSQVRDHEPHLALDGGEDGLNPYRLLAQQCKTLLRLKGFLACELGAGQFDTARTIFEASGWRVEPPLLDYAGIARVLCAMLREY